jgi:hypothetical protein
MYVFRYLYRLKLFPSMLRFFSNSHLSFHLASHKGTEQETEQRVESLYALGREDGHAGLKAEQFKKLTTSPTLVPSSRRAATRRNGKEEGCRRSDFENHNAS